MKQRHEKDDYETKNNLNAEEALKQRIKELEQSNQELLRRNEELAKSKENETQLEDQNKKLNFLDKEHFNLKLHEACQKADPDLGSIKLLLDKKADPNYNIYESASSYNITPLHLVTRMDKPNLPLIEFLVTNGGKILAWNNNDISVLTQMLKKNNSELNDFVTKYLKNITIEDVWYTLTKKHFTDGDYILKNTTITDIDKKLGKMGITLLSELCKGQYRVMEGGKLVEICKLLIEQKANVNPLNKEGSSPLSFALPYNYYDYKSEYKHHQEEQLELIQLLVEKKANCYDIKTWKSDIKNLPEALDLFEKTGKYNTAKIKALKQLVEEQELLKQLKIKEREDFQEYTLENMGDLLPLNSEDI